MTIYSLVPAVLKALHMEKHILTKEECRSVGEAGQGAGGLMSLPSWCSSEDTGGVGRVVACTEELLRQLQVSVYALYVTFCGVSETVQHQASPSTHVYLQQ